MEIDSATEALMLCYGLEPFNTASMAPVHKYFLHSHVNYKVFYMHNFVHTTTTAKLECVWRQYI